MRDGNSETETELQAAERRIGKIQRCGAARVASMEQSFLSLLEAIGEDPQREGLVRTPGRAARAFEFLTAGYRQSLDGIINNALFESEASEIILVKDIELYSLCEHHLLPFIGKAHVAYIPNGKVVGLSKTARIVDMQYGRANFRVVPDVKRPFIVEAAEKKIVATRCNFDVRCEDGKVQVVLIHGEADVKPASAPQARGERLTAGERLVASNDIETRDKPDLTHVLAWQSGYEMFDKEELAQAAEEMNRYSTAKLAVDPSVASLKVSGMYRVGDNSAFARSLAKLLPVTVRQIGDTLMLTADPDQ